MTIGLGWILTGTSDDLTGLNRYRRGTGSSLVLRISTGQAWVALANRHVTIEQVNRRVAEACSP